MSRRKQLKRCTAANIRLEREGPGRLSWTFPGYRGSSWCAWYITRDGDRWKVQATDLANGFIHRDSLAEVRKAIAEQYEGSYI